MIIDSKQIELGVTMLTTYLCEGIVEVKFTKKDGTERTMNCTKVEHLIPEAKRPKAKEVVVNDILQLVESKVKERPLQLITVFDVDKQEWRSFNYTTVKSIKLHTQLQTS